MNNRGQMTVEAVLIATLMVSILFATSSIMRDGQYLSRLVQGPWDHIAGMIESGYWAGRRQATIKHPNHPTRHGSSVGDPQ